MSDGRERYNPVSNVCKMKVPISIIIPIYNEADNLARCLESLGWADEIFVIDSNSIDGSQEIAQKHGAKLIQFKYNGNWPKKKNWALDNLSFKNDWVFIIDADEELVPEAEDEFREICTTNKHRFDGYFINRRFFFIGKWLKHAYYPNWNLRLFKHRLGRYEKLTDLPTESGDVEIHEHIILNGKAGYLKSEMNHYAFPTVEKFIEKHNRHSNWEARVAVDRYLGVKSAGALQSKNIGWRRKLKAFSKHLPFRPFLRFFYIYIIQCGFLDGREGYCFARLHAFYEALCIYKTYELKKALNRKPKQ